MPAVENAADDGLSRIKQLKVTENMVLSAFSVPSAIQLQDIFKEADENDDIQRLIAQVKEGTCTKQGYTTHHDRLFYKGILVLLKTSVYIPFLLEEYHDGLQGGHSGVLKTQKRIQSQFYWPKMRMDIQKYVSECKICQTHKYSTLSPAGLLQPLPIPERIWEDVSMDFIEGLPTSQDINVIMVVVDRLSKYGYFVGLKYPFNATDVVVKFSKEIIRLHGYPAFIVSERDKIFQSGFWRDCFKLAGTRFLYSTSFHPQTDGQTEVLNRCLETYLRCFASAQPKKWSHYLSWAQL